MDTRGHPYTSGRTRALVERVDHEFLSFWQGTFLGIALSVVLWTIVLVLGSSLR